MNVFTKDQIQNALDVPFIMSEIEKGLVSYSMKQTIMAPIGFLNFSTPPGEVHIKSGTVLNDEYYVVKVASSFYDNPKIGLPSSNGLMLLFSSINGKLEAILLDEGRLTDIRTGIAGAISAKYLANPVTGIGIIGTGTQARDQLYNLQFITDCKEVYVWGRDPIKCEAFKNDPQFSSFNISIAKSIDDIGALCNLIITTTSSTSPLLFGRQIRPGTHVTAVGADSTGKQELDVSVFEKADIISVDSLSQCSKYGDYSRAKHLDKPVYELGEIISNPISRSKDSITIADLTGVAVEDLQIAKAIYSILK